MSSPLETDRRLSRAWATSQLHIVPDAGHGGGGSLAAVILDALAGS